MKKALIIGAQNIDIYVKSSENYILHDSNLAKVHIAFGGVARNITENIKRLGNDCSFLTVFGDDHFSLTAKNSLQEMGVDISESLFLKDASNSVYLGVMDKDNDLFLGLNDMGILTALSPQFFETKHKYIDSFDIIIIDNNLTQESIIYLLNNYSHKTIVMDGVSTKKVTKIKDHLSKIDLLKVNQLELNKISKRPTVTAQIKHLQSRGSTNLLITNQGNDIVYATIDNIIVTNPLGANKIVNASGAGDAFLSGFVHGMIHSLNNHEKLLYAKKTAYITLLSNNSTNELLSIEKVDEIDE